MFERRLLPLELWLGRGSPLNPYLKGELCEFLRQETKPLDLKLFPDEVIVGSATTDFLEYTSLRSWVQQWLKYLRWYHLTVWSPGLSIQDFFEAPIVNRNWRIESTDPALVRFGLLWKVYDRVAYLGLDYQVPILTVGNMTGVVLLGGTSGRSFLLFADGVDQPRATRGVCQVYLPDNPSRTISRH